MKYWRVRTEKEKNIHYKGIDEKNSEKLFPYLFGGESYANSWDSSITICINEKKDNIEYTDVPMFATSFFIVNEKMLKILFQYAQGTFEVLNINCIDGNYVLINILDTFDCIDMEQSIYKVWKGAKKMFKIDYFMLEEEQKRISDFKEGMSWEIEGQICLYFNDKKIGFYEKKIDIGGEYLSLWFRILLEAVKQLNKYNEVFVSVPETTNVLYFIVCDSKLEVIKGKMGIQCVNEGVGIYSPSNIQETYWKEIIDYGEFQKEIQDKAQKYIEEVISYNEEFLETKDYKDLIHLLY